MAKNDPQIARRANGSAVSRRVSAAVLEDAEAGSRRRPASVRLLL